MRWLDSIYVQLLRWSGRAPSGPDSYDDLDYVPERSISQFVRSIGRVIGAIVLFPLFLVFLPFRGIHFLHNTGNEFDEDFGAGQTLVFRIKRILREIVIFPARLILAPLQFFRSLFAAGMSEIIFVLPAVAMIGLMLFVFIQVFARGDVIERRYQKGADIAFINGDYDLAKTYYRRLRSRQKLKSNRQLAWAEILANTGETEKSNDLINQLAPDDEMGYAPAHRERALMLARQIGNSTDVNLRRKLRWHLENSNDSSPEIGRAWAAFYLSSEQPNRAVAKLEETSSVSPGHFLMIAQIRQQQGKKLQRQFALQQAEKAYAKILENDELNNPIRIRLAAVSVQLESYDHAESILAKGIRLQPDDMIKTAMAGFLVLRHDRARDAGASVGKQLELLVRVLNLNPNFGPVYKRLMAMSGDTSSTEQELADIRKAFQTVVTGDHPSSMAHFALSNILWQEGKHEEAQFHIMQAYNMNKEIVIVINNLAWMLSHTEDPDLERALKLSELSIDKAPENLQFRDTCGTILMKLGRYREAVTELEKSLPGVSDKAAVHEKLATVYGELGMNDMARMHLESSKPAVEK